VALLRGVNVGGKNKVPMKELRALASTLGYRDVETYIQSGNVVFSADDTDTEDARVTLEGAIAREMGVNCEVVVLLREEVDEVMAADPFTDEVDSRRVHMVFRTTQYGPEDAERIDEAARRAGLKGSRDQVTFAGRTLYLWTPDGYGRSELAAQLSRLGGRGTARNRATVQNLAELMKR
jgi:uncharacterized protein (DUF1697 family)